MVIWFIPRVENVYGLWEKSWMVLHLVCTRLVRGISLASLLEGLYSMLEAGNVSTPDLE